MKKTEEELADELRKLKLQHQVIKKGKVRYNKRMKKAICLTIILIILLTISAISFNKKNFYLKDVKKNVSINTNKELPIVKEIEITKENLKMNFVSNEQNIIVKKGNTYNKLVIKGKQKPNIVFNRGVYDIDFKIGPIVIEVPSIITEITITDLLNKGVILKDLNLENLNIDANYIDKKSTIKIENSSIKNMKVQYNLGNIYIAKNSIVDNFSIKSILSNIILIEKSKVKNIKTDIAPATIFYFHKVKVKEIITNQNKFRYKKDGDTIHMNNNRDYSGRSIIVK